MNYEQKYKEALERARKLYKDAVTLQLEQDIKDYETIFPELKKSEDERIKKAIIDIIKFQKEQQCHIDGAIYDEMISWLEKQAPKSKWSEEDEIGSDETIELLEYFINYAPEFRKSAIGRSVAWLKSLKQRMEE